MMVVNEPVVLGNDTDRHRLLTLPRLHPVHHIEVGIQCNFVPVYGRHSKGLTTELRKLRYDLSQIAVDWLKDWKPQPFAPFGRM